MTTKQQQVDEIMDNFDFRKVTEAMSALKWNWARMDESPSEPELRKHARNMLLAIANSDEGVIEENCGGFIARMEDGFIGLSFVIESFTNNPDCL